MSFVVTTDPMRLPYVTCERCTADPYGVWYQDECMNMAVTNAYPRGVWPCVLSSGCRTLCSGSVQGRVQAMNYPGATPNLLGVADVAVFTRLAFHPSCGTQR